MRITFVTSKLNFATAGGSVPDLDLKARTMQSLGQTVKVITVFSKGNDYTSLPYQVAEENVNSASLLPSQSGLCAVLRKHEADTDVFHVEGQFLYGAGWYRLLGGRVPIVSFFNRELISWPKDGQTRLPLKQTVRLWLEKLIGTKIANRIDHFIFTTPNLHQSFLKFGLRGDRYAVWPDFVDPVALRASIGIGRLPTESRGIDKERFTILCSGRMIPEKGFDLVINAVSKLPEPAKIRVLMSGDGPEAQHLRELVKEKGLETQIEFPGWVEKRELLNLMAQSDIFILPKWQHELTSVLLLEAMSFGMPSLVPAGGGLEWLAGPAALNFAYDDPNDLADKLARLLADSNLRVSLASQCAVRLAELDHQKMGAEMLALFTAVSKVNANK